MIAAADQGSLVELPPLSEPCSDTEVLRDRTVDGGADQLLISELTKVPAMDQSDGGSSEGVVEEVLNNDASDESSSDRSRNCSSFRSGSS